MTSSPFRALGLPERPDLTDEQVRAADLAPADLDPADPDGADPDGADPDGADPVPAARAGPIRVSWLVRQLPARICRGRPLRLLARALVTYLLALAVLHLVPGQPAAPALVTGLVTWFLLTSRSDLAPPPER